MQLRNRVELGANKLAFLFRDKARQYLYNSLQKCILSSFQIKKVFRAAKEAIKQEPQIHSIRFMFKALDYLFTNKKILQVIQIIESIEFGIVNLNTRYLTKLNLQKKRIECNSLIEEQIEIFQSKAQAEGTDYDTIKRSLLQLNSVRESKIYEGYILPIFPDDQLKSNQIYLICETVSSEKMTSFLKKQLIKVCKLIIQNIRINFDTENYYLNKCVVQYKKGIRYLRQTYLRLWKKKQVEYLQSMNQKNQIKLEILEKELSQSK